MANVYSIHVEFKPENKESIEKLVSEKLHVPINNSMFNRHDTSLSINDLTKKEFDLLWNWLDSSGKITDIQGSDYNKTYKNGGMAENKNTEHYRYLDITKLPTGLKLELNEEGKDVIKEMLENNSDRVYIWSELFDDVQGNSEYIFHYDIGESGFGLTNAEGITDGYHYVGEWGNLYDTDYPDSAEVYWFPNYQIESPLETLTNEGSVIFTKANSFKTGGTTGNKNWFQKAIAETGTLNLGGWKKTMPRAERRLRAYSSHKDASNTVHDASLSTARALQALANINKDAETKKKAKSDANYFFKQAMESKKKKVGSKMKKAEVYAKGGQLISTARAREISNHWHGGQLSALYQFGSSGVYMPENHLRYLREVQSDMEPEYYPHPGTLSKKNEKELNSLKRYFEYKGEENGIKTEWHKHPTYGYLVPFVSRDTPNDISDKVIPLKLLLEKGGTTLVTYDIYDDGELEKQSITERELIDFANTVSHYERTDNDEPEATNYSDALAILKSLGYTVKERFSNGGTTSSAWTKFKKWLGEKI